MGKTVSVDEAISVRYGSFSDCMKTFEWSPLFKATAYKYNCKEIGGTVLEEDLDDNGEME